MQRPTIVVEDDPFLRLVGVVLDPDTSAERHSAFAHFFAHDLPDFAGWVAQVRSKAGQLYPAEVRLATTSDEFRAALRGARVAIIESYAIGPSELALADCLEVAQKYGAIPRSIDTTACGQRKIKVLTLRRRSNISCAEHAIALMLMLAKKLNQIEGLISVEQIESAGYKPATFDRRHTAGSGWARVTGLRTLYGSTLGIIGFGEIGRELALRANAFGMKILYYQRTRWPEDEERRWNVEYAPLGRLLDASDWICPLLPADASTRDLIGRAQFAQMKRGASLVNVSRADIVNRDALLEALDSGRLGGFALDPLYEEPGRADDPLLKFANVIMTPHTAAQPRFNALNDMEELIVGIAKALGR